MKYRSVPSLGAKADIRSAVRWYQRIDPNLAFRFTLEILATRSRIEQFPFQFPVAHDTTRRALLKRFPYSMYFDLNGDEVSVIAVVINGGPRQFGWTERTVQMNEGRNDQQKLPKESQKVL